MEHGALVCANFVAFGELTEVSSSIWDDIYGMVSILGRLPSAANDMGGRNETPSFWVAIRSQRVRLPRSLARCVKKTYRRTT
jgi:hypothetical protein